MRPGHAVGAPHRFKPGISPNPGGRPKKADSVLSQLGAAITETAARQIARALVTKAKKGDLAAIREVLDRLDGTVTKRVEVTGEVRKTVVLSRPDEAPRTIEATPVLDPVEADSGGSVTRALTPAEPNPAEGNELGAADVTVEE